METTLKNLRYAVDKLQELANTTHPEIRTDFDISDFGCYKGLVKGKLHQCETVGCALGHMAGKVFPIVDSDFDRDFNGIIFNYHLFSNRVFPELNSLYGGLYGGWEFLFSSSWGEYQPTFDDFIKRAEHFLSLNGEMGKWVYSTEIKTNL